MKRVILPELKVITINKNIISCELTSLKMIGEKWIGCIIRNIKEPPYIWGRFLNVDMDNKKCDFKLNDSIDAEKLNISIFYKYLNGYWGERVELVFDKTRNWNLSIFRPTDAVAIDKGIIRKLNDGRILEESKIIKGGWNHEHCYICWETISNNDKAWVDKKNIWFCKECYNNYIKNEDISFVSEKN